MRVTIDVAFPGTGGATFGVNEVSVSVYWTHRVGNRSIEFHPIDGLGVNAVDTIDSMDTIDSCDTSLTQKRSQVSC